MTGQRLLPVRSLNWNPQARQVVAFRMANKRKRGRMGSSAVSELPQRGQGRAWEGHCGVGAPGKGLIVRGLSRGDTSPRW